MKLTQTIKKDFFMSSDLIYCLACTQDLFPLPREPWDHDILMYNYSPSLQSIHALSNYRMFHNVFLDKLCFELASIAEKRVSLEALQLTQIYGSMFIQFAKLTYLRIRGFGEEPLRLPRFSMDFFILVEICWQLVVVTKKFMLEDKLDSLLPMKLGNLSCKSLEDAMNIGSDL